MGYRKFRADRLFDGYRFHEAGQVLVMGGDGQVEGIVDESDAGDDVQRLAGILSPGFINCHCHLELSYMKGLIPEGTGLVPFVSQVMANRGRPEEEILDAIESDGYAMRANGIVAVGDICNTPFTLDHKKNSDLLYYNFIEVAGFDPAAAESRFAQATELAGHFRNETDAGQNARVSIVPHSPYSVSAALWKLITHEPANRVMSIHNQEDPAENEFFRSKTGAFLDLYAKMKLDLGFFTASGKSSIRTYIERFPAGQPLILVHNVHTSEEDLEFITQLTTSPSLHWCLCPQANRYISTAMTDVPLLMAQERRIVLGTDSLASNHQLDLLSEMSLIRQYYPVVADEQLLTWATSNGAAALQMDDLLGSFEAGKKPGVLLVNDDLSGLSRLM